MLLEIDAQPIEVLNLAIGPNTKWKCQNDKINLVGNKYHMLNK